MNKHEKFAMFLLAIAVLLMIISLFPGGYEEMTGILQGVGTGIISGVIVMVVTGIKGREIRKMNLTYDTIHELNVSLEKISYSYSVLYHATYHGKKAKMTFAEYAELIKNTYWEIFDMGMTIKNIYSNLNEKILSTFGLKEEFAEFVLYFDTNMPEINRKIINTTKDKIELDMIKDMIYELQNKAWLLSCKSKKEETILFAEKSKLINSLI